MTSLETADFIKNQLDVLDGKFTGLAEFLISKDLDLPERVRSRSNKIDTTGEESDVQIVESGVQYIYEKLTTSTNVISKVMLVSQARMFGVDIDALKLFMDSNQQK